MCKIYSTYFIAAMFVCEKFVFGNNEILNGNKENLLDVPDVRWPLGIVHYYFDHKSYDYIIARRVRLVMNTLEDASCLKFKPLIVPNHNSSWIHISNPDKTRECVHNNIINMALEVNMVLGYDCMQRKEIMHSLMHAVGFKDEVTHPRRDQYVRIMWENINPKYHELFRIRQEFSSVSTEYDSMSVMHFHDRAFTKNGQATIAPLIPGLIIYSSEELSPLDKMRLRLLFGNECNKRNVGDLLDSCKIVLHNETTNGSDGGESHEEVHSDQDQNHNNSEINKTDNVNASKTNNSNDNDDDEKSQSADNQNRPSDVDEDHGINVDEN